MSEVHPVYELDLWYFLSACATRLQELWYQPREEIDASLLRKLETSYLHQCLWRFHQALVVEFKEERVYVISGWQYCIISNGLCNNVHHMVIVVHHHP